ncbi:MAG: formylglycine-generating enzyme family protein [Lentisphaerae bacterium]|nr:formylglycine-generating enzyme family protein [Lentisphaerota bacterium]
MLFTAAVASPQVSNVAMSYEGSGAVKITYDLEGEPGIVLLDIKSGGNSIGDAKIAQTIGDVNRKISPGTGKTIWWSCSKASLDVEDTASLSAVVTAYSLDNPPDVLVLDLANTNSCMFYKSLAALPDGGLKNDIYRTSKLVMKKVPAKGVTFLCGSSADNPASRYKPYLASFTYDYYLGIYPITQGQQLLIDGQTHSQFISGEDAALRPVDKVKWTEIRYWADWPNAEGVFSHDNIKVTQNSFLAKFRRFGLPIDLPTSTEWEYACRAGKPTLFGNGTDNEAGMDRMGWYSGNSGGTTHPVGRKEPNDWGFYDMHGNVWEWCLDRYRHEELGDRTTVRENYPGEATYTSGYNNAYLSNKVQRGGSLGDSAVVCASHAFRNLGMDAGPSSPNGYRICVRAVIP